MPEENLSLFSAQKPTQVARKTGTRFSGRRDPECWGYPKAQENGTKNLDMTSLTRDGVREEPKRGKSSVAEYMDGKDES